ncbi:alpha/beta fold hydrolase [Catellatospora tritici]|uniref:alpha/beta fold hydrolase n=1 Tax=Catellatospora tritici TaxID=2851566 RepID=UPI001C2DDAA5|nr:alpha/beta hydrolase [Catellatospora tritici]MBV1851945.1 alpha/beta hydrolase [Catellatospora tritici]
MTERSDRGLNAPVDEACVLTDGPWTHRFVSANGSRFHVAELGSGPLVVLLHGFPEFWWAWHEQLPLLADAGFRAVAVDLRGYGATDKPPRGYDGFTLAADVVGLIRALGERSATVVGAGAGGLIAWSAAALHPKLVNRLVVLGAAHPLRLRTALVADAAQRRAGRALLRFQLPRYEHVLTRDGAELAGDLMRSWTGPSFRQTPAYEEYEARCREALRIPQAAFCAMEAYRWAFRSTLRLHGYRFIRAVRQPIITPTLQLQGALDPITLTATAQGSGRYVLADYEWHLIEDAGHFLHVERPDLVAGEIIRWAK